MITFFTLACAALFVSSSGHAADSSKGAKGYAEMAKMNLREGVNYIVLDFQRGSSSLSASMKQQLKALAVASKDNVDNIHVAVWSDVPFPKTDKQEIAERQEDLADERIEQIKDYLDDDLKLDNIETYSMAERSNWFARALSTDEGELKSLFSQQGAPQNVDASEFKVVRAKGGARKAVILVERETDETIQSIAK